MDPGINTVSCVGLESFPLKRACTVLRGGSGSNAAALLDRMVSNWMYLVAFLDWYSRYVIAWQISETLELPFVLDCCYEALGKTVPEIIHSDQGSHFTTERFTSCFTAAGGRVSMDGRGRYVDNNFTERLWHSVKYDEVYLKEYTCPRDIRQGLIWYLSFYNERRPHQALGNNYASSNLLCQALKRSEAGLPNRSSSNHRNEGRNFLKSGTWLS